MNTRQIDYIKNDIAQLEALPQELSYLKNKAVFITGCCGFMGSWILETITYLNEAYSFNTKVFATSRDTDAFKAQYPHLALSKEIEFRDVDVSNLVEMPDEVSIVLHLAATPDNRIHSSDPLRVINTIISGTQNVLESASRLPLVEKVLHISSGLIYGNQPAELSHLSEDYSGAVNCASSTSSYSEAKRMAETICHVYRSQMRLPILIMRPFSFIGPYQSIDRPWAINNFIRDAFSGRKIRILGDDQTVRSYMYPSDMARWVLKATGESQSCHTLNLGSSDGKSLRDISQMVANSVFNSPSINSQMNANNTTRSQFVPSTELAKEKFNLATTIDTETAIKKTIEWFQLGL